MNNKVPLKNLCIPEESGKYGIPASAEEFDENKIRYLRITDISEDGELLNNDKKSVSAPDIEKYLLAEGEIVFARTGNSTGKSYFHESKNGALAFAGFLIKYALDDKKVNPKYLKFYTISNEYKNWVKNLSVGSTRGNINAQTFADCPITVPERNQQDLLVKTLSPLIAKIDLNNRINAELEAMAKTLYDYWFVQFDFPNEDGKPYKSSGGKMVWSEELKREIPEGWEVGSLNDNIDLILDHRGKTPKKLGGDWVQGPNGVVALSAKIVKRGKLVNLEQANKVSHEMYEKWMPEKLKSGDILMTSEAPLGEFYFILSDTNYCMSQRLFAIRAEQSKVFPVYLYFELSKGNGYSQIIGSQSGSTVFGIRQDELRKIKILKPKIKTQKRFDEIVTPMLSLIRSKDAENQHLSQLRDWLLPMLMNGQVKVQ